MRRQTCSVPIGRWKVATDRDAGRMKNFRNRPTSRSFWGWPTRFLGSEPAFLSGSPLRPTRLSFELEEIVVRWPMAYGSKSAIERKQNDYAKICRTRRPQTVH